MNGRSAKAFRGVNLGTEGPKSEETDEPGVQSRYRKESFVFTYGGAFDVI